MCDGLRVSVDMGEPLMPDGVRRMLVMTLEMVITNAACLGDGPRDGHH